MAKVVKQLRNEDVHSALVCILFAIAFAVATVVGFSSGVKAELVHVFMAFAFSCAVSALIFLAMYREFNS
jgi:predicted membrane-bound mannosyltransferase